MKKGDIIVIFSVLAVAIIVFFAVFSSRFEKAGTVVVSKDNEIIFEGSLNQDKKLDIETNYLQIKDGKVKMIYANCKNQICVNHKQISQKGESIVCLPNKIIAEIK